MPKVENQLRRIARFDNRHPWVQGAVLAFFFVQIFAPLTTMIWKNRTLTFVEFLNYILLGSVSGAIGIILYISKRRFAHEFSNSNGDEVDKPAKDSSGVMGWRQVLLWIWVAVSAFWVVVMSMTIFATDEPSWNQYAVHYGAVIFGPPVALLLLGCVVAYVVDRVASRFSGSDT